MTPAYEDGLAAAYQGDCLEVLQQLPAGSVHACVTSPPYWGLRDYGTAGQLGLEATPEEYVAAMVEVFREVRRVLRSDGTLWLNLGDSYAGTKAGNTNGGPSSGLMRDGRSEQSRQGSNALLATQRGEMQFTKPLPLGLKQKDLVGIPWRVAFALQADGWYLRSDIVWAKSNPMPESVTDRPTKAHEYLFLLAKAERYYYDAEAIREAPTGHVQGSKGVGEWNKLPTETTNGRGASTLHSIDPAGRNKRSVWTVSTQPFSGAHFAVFPEALVEPCIRAGCPVDGTVLDPFAGSGTTLAVAKRLGRRSVGIELNAAYLDLIRRRVGRVTYQPTLFPEVAS